MARLPAALAERIALAGEGAAEIERTLAERAAGAACSPFDAYPAYRERGWVGTLRLEPRSKSPVPTGFSGREGVDPDDAQCASWAARGPGNLAIRMPSGVVGIDVDDYDAKEGKATLLTAEEAYGPLPDGPRSGNRGVDDPSCVHWFRVPEDAELHSPGPGVDLLQRHHRYAMAAPSLHPSGRRYEWYGTEGPEVPPRVDELPELPAAWMTGLSKRPAVGAAQSSRHDTMLAQVCAVVGDREDDRLPDLRAQFAAEVGPDRPGGEPEAFGEFDRAVRGALDRRGRGELAERHGSPATGSSRGGDDDPLYVDPNDPEALRRLRRLALDRWAREQLAADTARDLGIPEDDWAPVDLAAVDMEPVEPTLLRRTDGFPLLYPGRTHVLQGEPASGKSWVALYAVAERLMAGEPAAVVDLEDDARGVLGRLQSLGVPREVLLDPTRFRYLHPQGPLGGPKLAEYHRLVAGFGAELVLIDGLTALLSLHGLRSNEDVDIDRAYQLAIAPWVQAGATVVVTDHVTKSKEDRGRWAVGSQRKLGIVTGAVYSVERVRPFGRGSDGECRLAVQKDRGGYIEPRALDTSKRIADFRLDSRVDPDRPVASLGAPATGRADPAAGVESLYDPPGEELARVSRWIRDARGGRLTAKRQVREVKGLGGVKLDRVLERLIELSCVKAAHPTLGPWELVVVYGDAYEQGEL